jgi:hypothetical protein
VEGGEGGFYSAAQRGDSLFMIVVVVYFGELRNVFWIC